MVYSMLWIFFVTLFSGYSYNLILECALKVSEDKIEWADAADCVGWQV